MEDLERTTITKVIWRIMPLLLVCYFAAYLDRANVAFAKLQMARELAFSDATYGIGVGLFFVGYFFLEVPSNLALAKFGARRWIARIMVTWGVISASFAFIRPISDATGLSYEYTYYALRLLLGLAEAGFFPGIVFYLTLWFPKSYRARALALFAMAIPISSILGGPLSGAILELDAWGFRGWQWIFMLEAIPSIVLSVVILAFLYDRPRDARWLTQEQSAWLENTIEAEQRSHDRSAPHAGLWRAIANVNVLLVALAYFAFNMIYAYNYFLPSILKDLGLGNLQTDVVSSLPPLCGAASMFVVTRHSDHTGERHYLLALALAVAAIGFGLSAMASDPGIKIGLFCVAALGTGPIVAMIYTLPPSLLSGAKLAAGIGAINAVGNIPGMFAPGLAGWLKDVTGSSASSLLMVSVSMLLAAALVLLLRSRMLPGVAQMRADPAT